MIRRKHSAGRVIAGMSGGVDSSVAALLLKEQGYDVEGLFMKNWEEDDAAGHCSAAEDLADTRSVCERLRIPLHTVNFSSEYWDRVFKYFLDEHRAGRTPNPDVLCNKEIKFRAFLEHALDLGADCIATGHYAGIRTLDGIHHLWQARDRDKDQTYFLYALNQAQLEKALFPLAELSKSEVRGIAADHGFPNAEKRDSTGICFIGERNFGEFLRHYLPARPGDIRTPEGEKVGTHDGLMYYTAGQRQGLGIGGRRGARDEPWFVAGKDIQTNTLIVVQGHDHPLLYFRELDVIDLHWVTGRTPEVPFACRAKVRYRQAAQDCTITRIEGPTGRIWFAQPQRAAAPGQSAVFYADEECLGGGIIQSADRPVETLEYWTRATATEER